MSATGVKPKTRQYPPLAVAPVLNTNPDTPVRPRYALNPQQSCAPSDTDVTAPVANAARTLESKKSEIVSELTPSARYCPVPRLPPDTINALELPVAVVPVLLLDHLVPLKLVPMANSLNEFHQSKPS